MERDKLLGTMDAKVWTDEFVATKDRLGDEEFDHAMMLAWFANAIMAGFDEANRRAQRALDAERARVKELQGAASTPINELLAELISCAGVFDVSTDYEDDRKALETATQAVLDHVATLQAQLRQVEGERDHAKKMEAVQKEVADNQAWHVRQLRQLVEVHTKQLTELTIIPIGCSREQELRWTQSIKDLRATLAAKDAGKAVSSG